MESLYGSIFHNVIQGNFNHDVHESVRETFLATLHKSERKYCIWWSLCATHFGPRSRLAELGQIMMMLKENIKVASRGK